MLPNYKSALTAEQIAMAQVVIAERERCEAIVRGLVRHLQTSGASSDAVGAAQAALVDIRSGKVST